METNKNDQENNHSRRKFIQQSVMLVAGVMLTGTSKLFAEDYKKIIMIQNITSKGNAAKDNSGKSGSWVFERRAVGDEDILIDIKFCGICHSDIHQMKGDWGLQQYP